MCDNSMSYDKEVLKKLEEIQDVMNNTLDLNMEQVELASLKIICILHSKNEKTKHVADIIEKYVENYKEEYDWVKSTKHYIPPRQFLVPEIAMELKCPDSRCLPESVFEQYKIVLTSCYAVIDNKFDGLMEMNLEKRDAYFIKRLRSSIRNLLVDNVNLKGNNPYYKRNLDGLGDAISWWQRTLNGRLKNILIFINDKSVNVPEYSILISLDSLLDIVDSIFSRVEELNSLIMDNRVMDYPTDQYEASKHDCMDLYNKLMKDRLVGCKMGLI